MPVLYFIEFVELLKKNSLPFSNAFICEGLRWCADINLPPRPRSGVLRRAGDLETGAIAFATNQSGCPPVFSKGNEHALCIRCF